MKSGNGYQEVKLKKKLFSLYTANVKIEVGFRKIWGVKNVIFNPYSAIGGRDGGVDGLQE